MVALACTHDGADAAVELARRAEALLDPAAASGVLVTDARPPHEAHAYAHRHGHALLCLPENDAPPGADAPAVFAYDGTPEADAALRRGAALLRRRPALVVCAWVPLVRNAPVALLAVPAGIAAAGAQRLDEEARAHAVETAEAGAEILRDAGWSARAEALAADDGVWRRLSVEAGEHAAAVIVTGTHGHSHLVSLVLGGVSEPLAHHASRPVLIVGT